MSADPVVSVGKVCLTYILARLLGTSFLHVD